MINKYSKDQCSIGLYAFTFLFFIGFGFGIITATNGDLFGVFMSTMLCIIMFTSANNFLLMRAGRVKRK